MPSPWAFPSVARMQRRLGPMPRRRPAACHYLRPPAPPRPTNIHPTPTHTHTRAPPHSVPSGHGKEEHTNTPHTPTDPPPSPLSAFHPHPSFNCTTSMPGLQHACIRAAERPGKVPGEPVPRGSRGGGRSGRCRAAAPDAAGTETHDKGSDRYLEARVVMWMDREERRWVPEPCTLLYCVVLYVVTRPPSPVLTLPLSLLKITAPGRRV